MQLSEQKKLGLRLLAELNEWRPTILAGGAPRDWDFGELANDLDFFILEDFDPVEIEGNYNIELAKVGGQYEGTDFEVWEGSIDGQDVQFIRHFGSSLEEHVIRGFPCALSKIWYDVHGELHKHDQYVIARDFGRGLLSLDSTPQFYEKTSRMMQSRGITPEYSMTQVLKKIGGVQPAWVTRGQPGGAWVQNPAMEIDF